MIGEDGLTPKRGSENYVGMDGESAKPCLQAGSSAHGSRRKVKKIKHEQKEAAKVFEIKPKELVSKNTNLKLCHSSRVFNTYMNHRQLILKEKH